MNKLHFSSSLTNDLRISGEYPIPPELLNGICVDIGANVGAFTVTYGRHFTKVYSFEPCEETFNILKTNILKNSLINVEAFNEAVSNFDGVSKLKPFVSNNKECLDDSGGASIIVWDRNSNTGWKDDSSFEEVKTISFNTLLNRVGGDISILKVDCEGSEYDILMNSNLSNIKFIIMELHCMLYPVKSTELVNYILSCGFKINHTFQELNHDSHQIISFIKDI